MMALVACDDPGLVILPTHRVVRQLDSGARAGFLSRASEFFSIEEVKSQELLRARFIDAGSGEIGVALRGTPVLHVLRMRNVSKTMMDLLPAIAPVVRELDVSVLHAAVFNRIFGIGPNAINAGGNIEYTTDAAYALDAVGRGAADGAFLMHPPTISDVERVSEAGATMPEKSTYFFPKLATGLLLNPLND
jgi:uncharacterized protein (DUF1015 family)